MTMETGECKGMREASGAEFEGKSVQELVPQEDERRSGECNGIARGEAEDVNEVAKDDVEGSYVFVHGDSDELSEKDLDVSDKVDLDRSQRDEPSVEPDDLCERDLGDDSKVDIRVSNTEGCAAENSALTPIADAELEGRTSKCKESGDHNEEKGGLVSSVEKVHSTEEKVELILENCRTCKENDAPNLDLDVETPNIQEDTSVNDTTEGHPLPDPDVEIENVSCKEQGCGESLGDTIGNLDAFKGEIIVNSKVEDQEDGEFLTTTPEIKDMDSEPVAIGAECASMPPVNGKEMMSFNSEERLPAEEQSEIVVSVTHKSESLPLGDEETLASNGTEYNRAEEQVKIVVTERSESESLPLGDADILASNGTEDYPAAEQTIIVVTERSGTTSSNGAEDHSAGQAKVEITERSGSESTALVNEGLALNSAEDIPAVEQIAQLEQESEIQSTMEVGDKSHENSEIISIGTVDELKREAGIDAQESSEIMHSCPVKQPDAEAEATEVLVESPEGSSIFSGGDEGSVKEVTSFADNTKIELEVGNESAGSREDASACSANDTGSRTVNEEITIEDKVYTCPPVNVIEPEAEEIIDSIYRQDRVSAFPEVETRLEEIGETICAISDNNITQVAEEEIGEDASSIPDNDATQTAEEESRENVSVIPANDTNKMPVTEGSALSVETNKDAINYNVDDVKLEPEIGSGHVEHGDCMTDSIEEIESANKEDHDILASAEDNATEQGPENEALVTPTDDSGNLSLPGQKVDLDVKKLPIFMVRVPRFSDDKLKMQIQHAQQEVDEKTGSRDSIRLALQKQKDVCAEYWQKVEDARKEERDARDAVASKRQEIDSIQSVLNKLKNATSISDIDNRIHKLQHRINHETNTLKEEKSLIREMNQLKQSREHLSSSLASEEELQEAFEKQEQMETCLKHLKEELDTLRKETLQAEGNTKDVKSRYDNQCEYLRDLQSQFKVADDLRQDAYTKLRNLKKELYVKNEHFYSYKDDMKVATNYVFSGDREALRSHCNNQIEKLMELWNKNDEFRHQYVKANLRSTLRRFRTLDGRSLGPDEEPVIIHNPIEQKENIVSPHVFKSNTPTLTTERNQENAEAPLSSAKMNSTDGPTLPQKSQSQKPKKVTKPATKEVVSNRESDKEEAEKETKRTMEEEEQARKAEELAGKEEELRKEKEAAEMKEQHRLEQIAKAKEAEERKKRKAEKAQAKAEIRAQKEAELREKKREKKEKKERKSTTTTTENVAEAEAPAPDAEVPQESVQEQAEKSPSAPSKRSSRPRAVAKKEYNKLKPLPAPLRNRGKRKMQTWMWVLLTALVVLALFMVGNYVAFSKFGLRNISF